MDVDLTLNYFGCCQLFKLYHTFKQFISCLHVMT